jgi:hypothetical protein
MQTAAPSFCPLEFPAVTVASGSCFAITGCSAASASSDTSARGCSSVARTGPWMSRGMISSVKRPDLIASTDRL